MVISPRISEKAYGLSKQNIYVFDVPMTANKSEVINALKAEYPEIEIADVRLMIVKGKAKAFSRGKHARPGTAYRSNKKKAYVTVKSGVIEVFKNVNESEEQ